MASLEGDSQTSEVAELKMELQNLRENIVNLNTQVAEMRSSKSGLNTYTNGSNLRMAMAQVNGQDTPSVPGDKTNGTMDSSDGMRAFKGEEANATARNQPFSDQPVYVDPSEKPGYDGSSKDPETGLITSDSSQTRIDAANGAPADPNVVDWDGGDDPKNPMNWPGWKIKMHVVFLSLVTFTTQVESEVSFIQC